MKAVSGLQLVLACRLLGKWVLAVGHGLGLSTEACLLAGLVRAQHAKRSTAVHYPQSNLAGVKIQVQVVAERGSGSSSSSADGSEGSTAATSGAASMQRPDGPAWVAALAASLAAGLLLAT